VVVLLIAFSACNSEPTDATPAGPRPSPTSKAIQGGPDCGLPEKIPAPAWQPKEVPLPAGTYFYKQLPSKRGLDRGLFVVRIDVKAFKRFIDSDWPPAGIQLLRPDREPGEVEDIFATPRGTGVFKANDVICKTPYTRLLLIYGK
jgi:hypothetical protein